jgi:hypothetical protein
MIIHAGAPAGGRVSELEAVKKRTQRARPLPGLSSERFLIWLLGNALMAVLDPFHTELSNSMEENLFGQADNRSDRQQIPPFIHGTPRFITALIRAT